MSAKQWLKRNAWALAAIPLLTAGVFGAVALEKDLGELFSRSGATPPDMTVAAGETIALGGVEFGPVEFRVGSSLTDGNQPPRHADYPCRDSCERGRQERRLPQPRCCLRVERHRMA